MIYGECVVKFGVTSDSNSYQDGGFSSYPQGWALYVSDSITRHNSNNTGTNVF